MQWRFDGLCLQVLKPMESPSKATIHTLLKMDHAHTRVLILLSRMEDMLMSQPMIQLHLPPLLTSAQSQLQSKLNNSDSNFTLEESLMETAEPALIMVSLLLDMGLTLTRQRFLEGEELLGSLMGRKWIHQTRQVGYTWTRKVWTPNAGIIPNSCRRLIWL